MHKSLCLIFLFYLPSVFSQEIADIDYYKKNDSINLFVFVGEKISIEEFDPNAGKPEKDTVIELDERGGWIKRIGTNWIMDRAFRLKYRVLKKLYNDVKTDTVEFVAYDHYGEPPFAKFNTIILYLGRDEKNSSYYHKKYSYNPIYKSKDKEWVALLTFGNRRIIEESRLLRLRKIKLDESANIDVSDSGDLYVALTYPKPFYKIRHGKAIPIRGISIKELMEYRIKYFTEELE